MTILRQKNVPLLLLIYEVIDYPAGVDTGVGVGGSI